MRRLKKTFKKFINFLFMDVKNEKETKDLAILIRLNCLVLAMYFFVIGITVAYQFRYGTGLSMAVAAGLTIGAFILTYEDLTRAGLALLNTVVIIFPGLLSLMCTYECGFQYMMFLNILYVYFNKGNKPLLKRIFAVSLLICMIFLNILGPEFPYFLTPSHEGMIILQILNILGFGSCISVTAYCYSVKFNQSEDKLRRINENLEKMANLDTLTGLSNRRHMNEYLADTVFEYDRSGKIFTMVIGDIDFFKKVNDTYGHDTGDYVLTTMADIFKRFMKDKGHVARWGGEEFLFAFENTKADKAFEKMEELRKEIEATPIQFKDYDFSVTMTFGLEEYNPRLGIEATINRADSKLYEGKTGGRNRVIM